MSKCAAKAVVLATTAAQLLFVISLLESHACNLLWQGDVRPVCHSTSAVGRPVFTNLPNGDDSRSKLLRVCSESGQDHA